MTLIQTPIPVPFHRGERERAEIIYCRKFEKYFFAIVTVLRYLTQKNVSTPTPFLDPFPCPLTEAGKLSRRRKGTC